MRSRWHLNYQLTSDYKDFEMLSFRTKSDAERYISENGIADYGLYYVE